MPTKKGKVKEIDNEKPEQSIATLKATATRMTKAVDEFQIIDDESLALVSDKIQNIKKFAEIVKQKKEDYTLPAKAIMDQAKSDFDPILATCKEKELLLKQRASTFMQKRDEARREEEAKLAKKVEEGRLKPETAVKKLDAMPVIKNTVRTDQGSGLRMSKRRVAEIEQPELIPEEFWIIDETRVRKEALERDKYGKAQIPGVTIREVVGVASV